MNLNKYRMYLAVTNGSKLEDFMEVSMANLEQLPDRPTCITLMIPYRSKNEVSKTQEAKSLQLILEIALLEQYKQSLEESITTAKRFAI